MDELIMAVLDRIENELDRCYWNKNQKEMDSPFKNTGSTYKNKVFSVRAYNWIDDQDDIPNFDSKFLKCWWYKHSHRGLLYAIDFNSDKDNLPELARFLDECINAIKEDFGE